jgi:lipid II:glycine glycyltransferase (peptidoglycan interpeptide bridge formation enzyme)
MELIDHYSKGISYRQIWFNNTDLSSIDKSGVDVLEFKESYIELSGLYPFKNGVIPLRDDAATIFEKFEKGFKYEVRRAEKERYVCSVVDVSDNASMLNVYSAYQKFAEQRKLSIIAFSMLQRYQDKNYLRITSVAIDGVLIQFHVYFTGVTEDVLLASFPAEGADHVKKTAVGFANRHLHWFDIQLAIEGKKTAYNLGGIGNNDDPATAGIVKFKMEMSPEVVTYYQGVIPVSLKGTVFLKLKSIPNKVLKR